MNNKYITLGKLAKLSHVNRDTLSFYVRKELIKPAHIGTNGYKYFMPDQVQTINFIRFYRQLNFSLESIKTMLAEREMEHSHPLYTLELLRNQQQYLHEKIQTLQSAEKLLKNESAFMNCIEQYELNTPFIEFLDEAMYYLTPVKFCCSLKEYSYAKNFSDFFMTDGNFFVPEYPICCIIPNSVLLTENFCPYHNNSDNDIRSKPDLNQTESNISITDESSDSFNRDSSLFVRPSGKYAVMVNQGRTDSIYPSVKKIIGFLKDNSIIPKGDAYIINSYNFLNISEDRNCKYLVQISID